MSIKICKWILYRAEAKCWTNEQWFINWQDELNKISVA